MKLIITIYLPSFGLKIGRSRKTDGYGNLQSSLICILSVLSMATTFDFHILELFFSYARVIILLESINCVKDRDDDGTSLNISNNISDHKGPRRLIL